MSILDALPGIAFGAFGPLFPAASLRKTASGASDGQGGFAAGASVDYPCKALVDSYSDVRRAMAGIPDTDRKVTILSASLPAGVAPSSGDAITVEGRAWTVIAVSRDPAAATYELQGR